MALANEMRRSGISVVGDRPWGTDFCNFYESRKDLLDMLLSYLKMFFASSIDSGFGEFIEQDVSLAV